MIPSGLAQATPRHVRALCRCGAFNGPTAGVARGFVQANLVVLDASLAEAFEAFCRANPKPCPLLEVTPPGQYEARQLAPGSDLRTDLPRYRVLKEGRCVDRPGSIEAHWYENSVAFLIGCSFTFEAALIEAGLPVRHIEQGRNVPMYRTNIRCRPVDPFEAPLVVSMRPMTPRQAAMAARVTSRFSHAHGAPVHIGDPAAIGIDDLSRPDYGETVDVREGEVPVFWACGVTPMAAIEHCEPPLAITHEPGHMFVTDVQDGSLDDRDESGAGP
ncbi:MAG: putative hydro-lyase [Phycisphaerae bacterium]